MASSATNPITDSNPNPNPNSNSKTKPQVSIENNEELRKIFNQFDANGDGKISLTELGGVMKAMGSTYSENDLKNVMVDLDTDKDGYINLSEFATFCGSTSDSNGETELRDAFDLYDQNKDGLITDKELHLVLNRLGMKCSIEECLKMIKSVDSDGDGKVDFEEFKKMMTTSVSKTSGP